MSYSRRQVLAASAFAGTSAVGGCLRRVRGGAGTRLGRFTVSNFDREPHEFSLRVEDDDGRVHQSSHHVQGRTDDRIFGATAPCEWSGRPGEYEVGIRVDGGEWTTAALRDENGLFDSPDCLVAVGEYDPESGLRVRLTEDCDRYDGQFVSGPCAYVRTDG